MTKTFVDSVEGGIEVHGWAETNARLIANWVNGPKGGRPPNNPTETHGLSQEKPNGNPSKTIGVTDRLDRVDKINETLERLRLRVGKMMGRRESTAWSEKELKQLRVVLKANTPEEDLVVLEAYYASGFKYLRQDIPTLLNNWNGEIDRAKKHSGAAESKFPETHEPWKKSQPVDYDKMTPEERVQFAIG
jgi:hypothetical protein